MWRRWSLALGASILAHLMLVVVALGLGFGSSRGLGGPIDVQVTGMRLDEVKDLPLGGPASGNGKGGLAHRHVPSHAPPAPDTGTLATREDRRSRAGTALDSPDENAPAPTNDLEAYGPRGSRLTVLMRLDRLRGTDYVPSLDALLARLPDRRDLMEGTGLDLFDGFDAILIATPHPLDPSVTFLAARHHLDEGALRAALNRGARATGRTLTWRTEAGRPVGERRARSGATLDPLAARDNRLIVLAAPGLAVVTPPAYRDLLLAPPPRSGSPDGGDTPDAEAPAAGAADAGAGATGLGWARLLSRIDAEEGLMPPDGVAMVSAVDIFKKAGGAAGGAPPVVYGMPVPSAVRSTVGLGEDGPFVEVEAVFDTEAPARQWELEWPSIQQKLRANPYLLLSGFSTLATRAVLSRFDRVLRLRLAVSHDEAMRLLQFAVHMLGG